MKNQTVRSTSSAITGQETTPKSTSDTTFETTSSREHSRGKKAASQNLHKKDAMVPIDPKVSAEVKKASRQFCEAVRSNEQLAVLCLVDPIRAFNDAGISISRAARKYLQRAHPDHPYGDTELYEKLRDGKLKVPWIKSIEVSLMGDDNEE